MQIFKNADNLGYIKDSHLFSKVFIVKTNKISEISTMAILEYVVQTLFVLVAFY